MVRAAANLRRLLLQLSDPRIVRRSADPAALSRETRTAAGAVGISDDGGKTWSKAVDIDNGGHRLDAETDVIELADGRLWAAERSEPLAAMLRHLDRSGPNVEQVAAAGLHRPQPLSAPHCERRHHPAWPIAATTRSTSPGQASRACVTASTSARPGASRSGRYVRGAYPSMVNLKDGSVLIVYYEEGAELEHPRQAIPRHANRHRMAIALIGVDCSVGQTGMSAPPW